MTLQQQPRGMQDVLIVIHNQKPGIGGKAWRLHLFTCEQVSAYLYAHGQVFATGLHNPLKLLQGISGTKFALEGWHG